MTLSEAFCSDLRRATPPSRSWGNPSKTGHTTHPRRRRTAPTAWLPSRAPTN
jgi:hypothetical protein